MLPVGNNSVEKTLYEVLSVEEHAHYDEIRASYKAAVMNSHPDKLFTNPKSVASHDSLHERFLDVQRAWEVLSDPESRANYDLELRSSRQELEVPVDEIKLGDMEMETLNDGQELSYQCRCGDYFSVTSLELAEMGISLDEGVGAGASDSSPSSILLPCGSCSLKICLVIGVN